MNIDPEILKQLMKDAVKEALQELEGKNAPQQQASVPTYEQTFHQVMADVARGTITAQDAGKLLADAYAQSQMPPQQPPAQQNEAQQPQDPGFSNRVAGWEDDFSKFNAQQTENTLQMLERMKAKLQARINEADFYREMKKISAEEAKAKAAADLQALKDKMSKKE